MEEPRKGFSFFARFTVHVIGTKQGAKMSKTLQTYPDGSELTVVNLGAAVGVGLAFTAITVTVLTLKESKVWKKFKRKHSLEQG